jgi:predicted Zn-ribbon and HTH transcriptional regulator
MIYTMKEVLDNYINKELQMPRAMDAYKVENVWTKINSTAIAENAVPDKLVSGTLFLNVKNSAWAQQISLMKTDILMALNRSLGANVVSDIRTRTGLLERKETEKKETTQAKCASCGVEFLGEEENCPICSREKKQGALKMLFRKVNRNPKITFSEAKRDVPGINDVDFRRVKRDLNAMVMDKKERERRNRGREKSK